MRMSTQETWGVGTVWAIDVWHAPFGVSFCVFLLSLSLSRVGHVDVLLLLFLPNSARFGLHCGLFHQIRLGQVEGKCGQF